MGFPVKFYSFAKRQNSTKQPDDNTLVAEFPNCELKSNTNILAPVLAVYANFLPSPSHINYCYIPIFERYYYVSNWVWDGGIWYCSCNTDVLATHKTFIRASQQYIERCSDSRYWNGTIVDALYPCKSNETVTGAEISDLFINPSENLGFFVLGVVNAVASRGSVTHYALSATQLSSMKSYLMSEDAIQQIMSGELSIEITPQLLKSLYNPFQYIVSCTWFPFDISVVPNNPQIIRYGYWQMPESYKCTAIVDGFIQKSFTITFPANPQASDRGSFLNFAPYTKYGINIQPFGQFAIPPELLNNRKLDGYIRVDIATGVGVLYLKSGNYIVQTSTAMVGVDTPLSQITQGFYGQMATAFKIAVPSISKAIGAGSNDSSMMRPNDSQFSFLQNVANTITAPITNIATTVADAISANDTQITTLGTQGSKGTYTFKPSYYSSFKSLVTANDSDLGRPVCQYLTINSITNGFIKCSDAHVVLNASLEEIQAVEANMNAGFFYE